MSRDTKKQLGIWSILGIGFLLGYVVAFRSSQPSNPETNLTFLSVANAEAQRPEVSPVGATSFRDIFYPGTE